MKNTLFKLFKPTISQNWPSDLLLMMPRIVCGLMLAFDFGASKFGMPWSYSDELPLFHVKAWFIEDVASFGGLFALAPILFAWLGAASEAVGGVLLALGLKTRLASFLIICTMLTAIIFQKWDQGIWGMLPAMGFLWVGMHNLISGGGRFSIDFIITRFLEKEKSLHTPLALL